MTDEEEAELHAKCEAQRVQDLDKFRVVLIDNYNRDHISDRLHSAHKSSDEANAECTRLQDELRHTDPDRWPTVYEPGKKLYVFEP